MGADHIDGGRRKPPPFLLTELVSGLHCTTLAKPFVSLINLPVCALFVSRELIPKPSKDKNSQNGPSTLILTIKNFSKTCLVRFHLHEVLK
jgi:hypothetical protein